MSTLPAKAGAKKRRGKNRSSSGSHVPAIVTEHDQEARFRREEIVVEEAADPINPRATVSRMRAFPAYAWLHSRHRIDEYQREAADRYAIQHEMISGARWLNGETVGGGKAFWDRVPASDIQLDAIESIRAVELAMGHRGTMLIRMLILEDMGVVDIAKRLGESPGPMMGEVKAALTRASEHWGLDKKLVGPPSRIR